MPTPPNVKAYRARMKAAGFRYIGMWMHHSLIKQTKQHAAQSESLRKAGNEGRRRCREGHGCCPWPS